MENNEESVMHGAVFICFAGLSFFMAAAVATPAAAACQSVLDHRTKTLAGEPRDLCEYQGKVVLVVNTASYCGYTPQYEGLEKLYQSHKDKGLVVLGFPSNDFGAQEPGSNETVKDFCERTYKVRFPMFEKSIVKGADANPVYRKLTQATGAAPQWNFHKYLISRDGKTIKAYSSKVAPDSAQLVEDVESMLK
jgi:glutathione peroxidase